MSSQTSSQYSGEAIPLGETGGPHASYSYVPDPAVDALNPTQPEVLPVETQSSGTLPQPSQPSYLPPPASPPAMTVSPATTSTGDVMSSSPSITVNSGSGGMIISQGQVIDQNSLEVRGVGDPFGTITQVRTPSSELFKADTPADSTLVQQFVSNPRMNRLFNELQALQEVVLENVSADRTMTDVYLQDLLHASELLMKAPENFDDAQEIAYRVKADILREKKVRDDIASYRPTLIIYYIAWVIGAFLVLMLLIFNPTVAQIIPADLPIMKLAFAPMIFGVFGALMNGFMAINEHTSVKRDFDPIHASWYFINPIIGGVMGLVVFVFFVVTGASLTPAVISNQATMSGQQPPFIIWVLAFAVGWQQNVMFALLNRFLKTFLPDKLDTTSSGPVNVRPPLQTAQGTDTSSGASSDAKG